MNYRLLSVLVVILFVAAVQVCAERTGSVLPAFTSPYITETIATDCNNYILLQWKVTDNATVDHYEIERMDTDGTYRTIALLLCDDQSTTEHYIYKDKITVRDLRLQYRIKMILTGGGEQNSNPFMAEAKSAHKNLIPAAYSEKEHTVTMSLPGADADYVFRFYNIMGKMTKVTSAKTNQVPVSDLKRGSYFVEAFQPQTGKRYYAEFRKTDL